MPERGNKPGSTSVFNARRYTYQRGEPVKGDTKEGNRVAYGTKLASPGAEAADDERLTTQWNTLTLAKGHW